MPELIRKHDANADDVLTPGEFHRRVSRMSFFRAIQRAHPCPESHSLGCPRPERFVNDYGNVPRQLCGAAFLSESLQHMRFVDNPPGQEWDGPNAKLRAQFDIHVSLR